MTPYDLHLLVSGLFMLVPDPPNGIMHVLAPATDHLGHAGGHGGAHHNDERHFVRYVAPAANLHGLPAESTPDVTFFEWGGVIWAEIAAEGTHQTWDAQSQVDLSLEPTHFLNVSTFGGAVPARTLRDPGGSGVVSASLKLQSGRMRESAPVEGIYWELDEAPGQCFRTTNRGYWHIPAVAVPLAIHDRSGAVYTIVNRGSKSGVPVLLLHSIEDERMSSWPHPLPPPRTMPDQYHPTHFSAYHRMLPHPRPTPRYRTQCASAPAGATITGTRVTFGPMKAFGIHPITCIIVTGDPEPEPASSTGTSGQTDRDPQAESHTR